jgi:pyruvate carboxylase
MTAWQWRSATERAMRLAACVQSQIKIAGGATLGSMGIGTQEDVGQPLGYALQCRITAEDPAANFQVSAGTKPLS